MINQQELLRELGLVDEPRLLVELTIQISQNQSQVLCLYENQRIDEVVSQFCQKFNMDKEINKIIEQKLRDSLSQEEKENYFSFENQGLHDRLYNDARLKKMRQEKLEQKLNQSKPDIRKSQTKYSNMYEKQIKQKQIQEQQIIKQKQKQEEKETEELTFKPQLSSNTLKIVNQNRQTRQHNTEYYLIKHGQQIQNQKRQAEMQKEQSILQECSFTPEINRTSQKTQNKRPKHEELYQLAKEKKITLTPKPDKESTFKPQINKSPFNNQYMPFLKRVDMQMKIKEQKSKEIESSFRYDQKSGQELFKPSIRDCNRSRNGLSIGEYLYQIAKKKSDESVLQFDVDDMSTHTIHTERSQAIVLESRKKRLIELFNLLDSDGDGIISSQNIKLENLEPDVLLILQPILLELESFDIYMNQATWVSKCLKYSESINLQDKNKLFINKQRIKTETDQSTFRPLLNQKSVSIIQKRQHNNKSMSMYEKCMVNLKQKERKINQLKEHFEQAEDKQCTFKPNIN
ncbi:hypothetical protein pb186bvf_012333 [Paramecium bursaria]